MTHLKIITILFFLTTTIKASYAQHHDHLHSENEIGLSSSAVYSPDHKEWGTGIHVHYFRMLSPHSKWSLGGGIEGVFADDKHFSFNAGVKYEVINRLSISLLPGILFVKPSFSLHTEIVYDLFHWENFHLGTAIDYSWSKDDSHFAVGIHAAYCF